MYEIFGEFNSAEEINKAAAGLKAEGDLDNIKVLAKENGIDEEIAQAYIDGDILYLTDDMMAAVGKIELEKKDIAEPFFEAIKDDLINYILTSCTDEVFAKAVKKKGKSLKGCFASCKKEINKALNGTNGGLRSNVVYSMQRDYYLKEE